MWLTSTAAPSVLRGQMEARWDREAAGKRPPGAAGPRRAGRASLPLGCRATASLSTASTRSWATATASGWNNYEEKWSFSTDGEEGQQAEQGKPGEDTRGAVAKKGCRPGWRRYIGC